HKENTTPAIEKIVAIFNDQQEYRRVWIYLTFIKNYGQQFIRDLDFFQTENSPIFLFIEGRIEQLESMINMGKLATTFIQPVLEVFSKLNTEPDLFFSIFHSAYQAAYKKFCDHITNPSIELIQEWAIYCNFNLSLVEFHTLDEFWNKATDYSTLSIIISPIKKDLSTSWDMTRHKVPVLV
ncbi:814_t:CDS:2, partial [Scutellospora calospora]